MADIMKKRMNFGGSGLQSTKAGLDRLAIDKKLDEIHAMLKQIVGQEESPFDADSLEDGMYEFGEAEMEVMPSEEEEAEYHDAMEDSEAMENMALLEDGEIDLSDSEIMEEGEADQDRILEDHKMDHGYSPDEKADDEPLEELFEEEASQELDKEESEDDDDDDEDDEDDDEDEED